MLEGRLLRLCVSRLLGDLVLRLIALLTRGLLSQVAVVHCGDSTRATRAIGAGGGAVRGDRSVVKTTRRCFQNSRAVRSSSLT